MNEQVVSVGQKETPKDILKELTMRSKRLAFWREKRDELRAELAKADQEVQEAAVAVDEAAAQLADQGKQESNGHGKRK